MYISDIESTKKEKVDMKGAKGAWIQWLIARENGAENYAMRLFTVEKGGKIPRHQHPWEHEILFLEGEGIVGAGEEERTVGPNNFAYIEPNIPHWYRNTGDGEWKFLCIIPIKD